MSVNRRQVLQSLALTGAYNTVAGGAESALTLDVLRNVSAAHGSNLSDERLRVLKPVLENRLRRLQAVRDFEVDDSVAPTQGILTK